MLCFLSTPFHTVMSAVSGKEQCAAAAEIAVFCCGSTRKDTRISSHGTAVFYAKSDDPAE